MLSVTRQEAKAGWNGNIGQIKTAKLPEIRTVAIEKNYRKFTQDDADKARIQAAKDLNQAKIDAQYYGARAKSEAANAASQTIYRRYQGQVLRSQQRKDAADNGLRKTAINASVATHRSNMGMLGAAHEGQIKFNEMQSLYRGIR